MSAVMDEPLNLDAYFPYFLGTISNRWTATSSQLYLKHFNIGIGEWRVLASIRALGSASSLEVRNLTSMDAGAISRSVKKLETSGFVKALNGRFAGRTKPFELTAEGVKLYNRVSGLALSREAVLLQDLSSQERLQLMRLMRKIIKRIDDL